MRSIHKSFHGVPVLRGVDLTLEAGEVRALLGENGAGKTTLMNILGGVLPPDTGEILLNGRPVQIYSPRHARSLGIAFVHQEAMLAEDLTVAENIFLGEEPQKFGRVIDYSKMVRDTTEVLERLGVSVPPRTPVRDLDAPLRQVVEIARAVRQNAKILILDEPTTSLTVRETERLAELIKTLSGQGVGIIFISHRLQEVVNMCNRYTVLRDGMVAADGEISDVDEKRLVRAMIGREMGEVSQRNPRESVANRDEPILQAIKVTCEPHFRNVSFTLREGEILGFTGLLGAGYEELFECLFGQRRGWSGECLLRGKEFRPRAPVEAAYRGVGYVPRDRQVNGIFPERSVLHNTTISTLHRLSRAGFIHLGKERSEFMRYQQDLNIKAASPSGAIRSLSGGNQQKSLLARWLMADVDLLILDNPTQGVDVAAKQDIYTIVRRFADDHRAVIVLTPDMQEALRICDRIVVMFKGAVVAEVSAGDASEELLMLYATGAQEGQGEAR